MNPAGYTMRLQVPAWSAYGVDSWDNVNLSTSTLTSTPSDPFHIVPVDLSNVQFVNSAGSTSKDTTLSATSNVAVLKITADTWSNTDTLGGDLDLAIDTIVFDEDLWGIAASPTYTIRKILNNQDGTFPCTVAGGKVTCVVTTLPGTSQPAENDFVLNSWEVADYVVEASWIALTAGDDSVKIQIDSLSAWAITYGADDTNITGYQLITDPQLTNDQVTNQAVTDI